MVGFRAEGARITTAAHDTLSAKVHARALIIPGAMLSLDRAEKKVQPRAGCPE